MLDALRGLTDAVLASPWLLLVLVGLAVVDALLPVVPSEATILAGGVAAAAGHQHLALVIAAAGLGSFLGETAGYLIGRGTGPVARERLLTNPRRAAVYERMRALLVRRGVVVLLVARFVPAGRTAATLAAGATGYPPRRFLAVTAVGAPLGAAWTAVLGYVGGSAFAGNTLLALGSGAVLATTAGLTAAGVRKLRQRGRTSSGAGVRLSRATASRTSADQTHSRYSGGTGP